MKYALISLVSTLVGVAGYLPAFPQGPQLVTVVPPTPNAAAFQKYGDIPVSAYTGIPDISIPLYTAKFRDISVPISLSYHASGIKVSEEASQVGLGWVLNAGGNITRNIVGQDDFNGSVYFNGGTGNNIIDFSEGETPVHTGTSGCVLNMFDSKLTPSNYNYDLTTYLNASPLYDFQPDQYYYNFQGHSGKFILKRNMQAVVQNQEKIQLTPASNGTSWHVQTADGFAYDFTQYESYTDNIGNLTHYTGWYLTKITSPLGNTVTFTYTANTTFVQSVGGYSESWDYYDLPSLGAQYPTANTGHPKGYNPGKQYNNIVLSTINFTNGIVKFNYSSGRQDLAGDLQLDSVSIYEKDGVTLDKTLALTYSYFNGTNDPSFNNSGGATSSQAMRLKLAQVTEKGYLGGQFIQNPPYSFTYNDVSTNPAKTSFARDHWGYYNGVTGQITLIPTATPLNTSNVLLYELGMPGNQREPNPNYTQAFMLTRMTYPTGGWTQFDYESNDYDLTQSEVNDSSWFAGLQQASYTMTSTYGYDIQNHRDLNSSDTLDLTQEWLAAGAYPSCNINVTFRTSGGTGANCNDIGLPSNVIYFELDALNGNSLSHIDPGAMTVCNGSNPPCIGCQNNQPEFTFNGTYTLAPGKYVVRWYVNYGQTTYIPKLQDMHATVTWYTAGSSYSNGSWGNAGIINSNIFPGGGLRILRITNHDGINEANNQVRKYIYHYWADKTNSGIQTEYTYGRRMTAPQYAYFADSYDVYSVQTNNGCSSTPYYTIHLMRASDSDVPLNGSAKGSPVGYDQVTELSGENGEYGQKVYQYINNPDAVRSINDQYSGSNVPVQPPYGSTVPDMTNGSLLHETDYANVDGSFVKVKETINTYASIASSGDTVYGLQNPIMAGNALGDKCANVTTGPCNGNLLLTYKSLVSNWNILSQSEVKAYDQQNQSLLKDDITNYYYENPAHMQLTKTVTSNSKGELMITHTQYPLDFTNVSGTDAFTKGVANLQNSFVVGTPVEKYVQRSNSDGSNLRTTNAFLTFFNATVPTPAQIYQTEITAPITSFTPATTGSSGVTYNASYLPLLSFDTYDSYGNILQQHKVGDLRTSYVWDYNVGLPICEVKNASPSDIAYTSFEADGTGNWTITGGSTAAGGITGISSYALSNGSASVSKSGLNTAVTYVVSYWTTSSTPYTIAGTLTGFPVQGKTINGWTYFEHKLTGQSGVTVKGSGNIDELRLYPATAQMRTITFSPLIGVTSECDLANRISYYYYDGLGRLKFIKDQDGNILKTFQYHYMNQ